jgi:hypothetical protein
VDKWLAGARLLTVAWQATYPHEPDCTKVKAETALLHPYLGQPQKLLLVGVRAVACVSGRGQGQVAKVFCFFFSKKKIFKSARAPAG